MNLKNKVFGFVAAAALSLSMIGGAAADDVMTGTVTLSPGTCQAVISQGTANFGNWTFDGATNTYVSTGSNSAAFNVEVYEHKPNGKCPVSVQFNGLTNGTATIPASNFVLNVTGYYSGVLPSGTYAIPGGNYSGSLVLSSVPNTFQPGTYTGDITLQVGAGS